MRNSREYLIANVSPFIIAIIVLDLLLRNIPIYNLKIEILFTVRHVDVKVDPKNISSVINISLIFIIIIYTMTKLF